MEAHLCHARILYLQAADIMAQACSCSRRVHTCSWPASLRRTNALEVALAVVTFPNMVVSPAREQSEHSSSLAHTVTDEQKHINPHL